ncbi:hypothetical protein [Gimesia chilikensis]|nr:hypothetical protein [Gimesia chilikensis]
MRRVFASSGDIAAAPIATTIEVGSAKYFAAIDYSRRRDTLHG